ncbi:MAG TPA: hypothetical protein VFE96_02140 [Candidatus Bathyarchaeia archaeon]|nr:hypothetical protein [Candidatus Bathyarchaeia archaeon]
MSLSTRRVPLKALLLLTIFSLGSVTVSGSLLPLTFTDAQRYGGSFVLTVSPASMLVPQGGNATSIITVLGIQGFSGTVSLAAENNPVTIPVTFSPNKVSVAVGGSATSIVTVGAAKNATMGTYNLIVTGTAVIKNKILSSSAILTATVTSPSDFGLSASSPSITVTAGFSNSTNVSVTSRNGFSGTVSLSATVPFGFLGVMGGQNPVTVSPGAAGTTSLQVSAISSTTIGRYNITITGTSGPISHSCILTVNVVDPLPESLIVTASSLTSPTSLVLTLHNPGNTPVTLTSYSIADVSGDRWTLGNWTGPTIMPGSTAQGVLLIGAGCASCTYSGVPFAFQQFISGHTYTITVTTKLNTQLTFTVVAV